MRLDKKKGGAADVQYQSELVSILCVLISVPLSCFFFVAVSELAICMLLWNWGCFVFSKAWPVYRDDSLAMLDIECREQLEVWEGFDHSALGLSQGILTWDQIKNVPLHSSGYTVHRTSRWTPAVVFSCYKIPLESREWRALPFLGRTI